jgi:butyrate kinase
MINGQGGLMAYLGESDVRKVLERAVADEYAANCLNAMLYQTCKEVGAMATVLKGNIDAVIITGGIAHSKAIVSSMKERLSFLGKIAVYPGENEMEALAFGTLAMLKGEEELKELQ